MKLLLSLTLSGSALTLLLLALRHLLGRRLPSGLYYYAWLLVLLRFLLPLPGLVPLAKEDAAPELPPLRAGEPAEEPWEAEPPFFPLPAEALGAEEDTALPDLSTPAEASAESSGAPLSAPTASFDWRSPQLWLGIWAAGALLSFLWPTVSYLRFTVALRSRLREPEDGLLALYAALPGRKPPLYTCAGLQTPLMFGVLAPRIVLPAEVAEPELLQNILRHELCHYRRRDPLYKWFAAAVLSLHWFNPLSWLVRRELNRACELSCDACLLRSLDGAGMQAYGETLLRMAAGTPLPLGVAAATFSTEKRNLKERLEQIMNYRKTKGRALATLLALLLLCGCGAAAGPASSGIDAAIVPTDESAVQVSTVDEFLAAIRPNTTIILAPGQYDLSTASNYGEDEVSPYYAWFQVWNDAEKHPGYELQIRGVEDLTIRGAGEDLTTIAAVPRYANVLFFQDCPGLRIERLTAGHTKEPGFCRGGVLSFASSNDVSVDACGLFGCGTFGVIAQDCSNLAVTDSRIYSCSMGGVDLRACRSALLQGCTFEQNGLKAGSVGFDCVFTLNNSTGVQILNCHIRDNNAQKLLHASRSKDVLFLSNTVEKNSFMTCLFMLDQYPVTVDGCAFPENDAPIWIYGNGVFPVNAEGEALDAAALQAMEYRDIDPAAVQAALPAADALELPAGGSVIVKTVDEFLSAIGPDRTIILDGELFDLSAAEDYGSSGNQYYYWQENFDGPELVINGVSGLTIRAAAEDPAATTLAAVPRYANVLRFRDCEHISLIGFTAGHTEEPGSCSGGVLDFGACHEISMEACRLYGCGILGINTQNCTGLLVRDCEIYDCSQGGVHMFQTDGVRFLNCDIHDVPSPALSFYECGDLTWNDKPMEGQSFDVNEDGSLRGTDRAPISQEGEPVFAISRFDLLYPMEFQEGETLDFAQEVQQQIARGEWEALSKKLFYPFRIIIANGAVVTVPDAAEFLALPLDDLVKPEFRQRIAEQPLDAYGASSLGNSFCGGYLAFAQDPQAETLSLLRLTAISTETPLQDDREPEDIRAFYYTTEEQELTLHVGDFVTLNAWVYPIGLFPDAEVSWTASDPEALKLTLIENGRGCRLEAMKPAPGGITLTLSFRGVTREVKGYIPDPQPAPTPAP